MDLIFHPLARTGRRDALTFRLAVSANKPDARDPVPISRKENEDDDNEQDRKAAGQWMAQGGLLAEMLAVRREMQHA